MSERQYDHIAEQYRHSDVSIVKNYVVGPFLLDLLGQISGQRVIDLACGSGFATRIAKQAGASRVVGVDISAQQIQLALDVEDTDQLGIDYVVGDVAEMNLAKFGTFDVASAVFLLPYAANRGELRAMCRNTFACLVPGGRFINVLPNPAVPRIDTTKYQMTATMAVPPVEGAIRTLTFHSPNVEPVSFNQYYWSRDTYANAMREAGFADLHWINATVSSAGIDRYGEDFWDEYNKKPYQIALIASR